MRISLQAYRQILSNLVSNALKYTSEGSVRVSVCWDGRWVTVEITDSGMGIPADELPGLFTEFFRASNARRSQVQGTGLGLAGVKALVERCTGSLKVRSQEGAGSTFVVLLPLHASRPAVQGKTWKEWSDPEELIPMRTMSAPRDSGRLAEQSAYAHCQVGGRGENVV